MRILHLDPDDIDNPMSGGGPIRTHEIYRRLSSRHEITVLTPTFAGSTPELIRDGVRFRRLGRKIGDHDSSHHITFFFALPQAIRKMEYDLLIEDFMPPMSATFNPLFARTPVIGSVQWYFAKMLSKQYHLPFWFGEKHLTKLYKNFVVLSSDMKEHILSLKKSARVEVIPEGVEDELLEMEYEFGDYIFYLGRYDFDQKGLDLLLRAYAGVPENERLPLVLAGHGDQAPVEKMIGELGIGNSIKLLGKIDAVQRAHHLKRCRFVCMPSRAETFGMVIVESCAAHKPVIVFDHPPMNEVAAPDACIKVPPFEVEGYTEAMRLLLNADEAEIGARGEKARFWAGKFSWDSIAARQEAFYEEILEAGR